MPARKVRLGQLEVVKGVFYKTYRIFTRYIGSIVMIAALPYMLGGMFLGIGYAVAGGRAPANFAANTGVKDPLLFFVLGGSLMIAAMIIIENTGSAIREEQMIGTFELHYLTPNNMALLWLYHSLPIGLLMVAVFAADVAPILLWRGGLLGPLEWAEAAGILFLSLLPLVGIGLVLAALVIRFKEIWAVINTVNAVITLLSGFYYPLEIFPLIVQEIAALLPTSHAARLLRWIVAEQALPPGAGLSAAALVGLSIVYLAAGFAVYKRWEDYARLRGELSKY